MKNAFILFTVVIFFIGCGAGKSVIMKQDAPKNSTPRGEGYKSTDGLSDEPGIDKDKKKDSTSQINPGQTERKRIKTGTINYNVIDLKSVEKIVTGKVKEFDGYVVSSNISLNNASIQVKIPFEKFDRFLEIIGNFGKIISKSINVEDVTFEYYDLEGRIKNKKIMQTRLQNYLAGASKIEDLLKIETELNKVTGDIEKLEGSFRNLSGLIAYSTLTLNFYVPGTDIKVKIFPSIKKGFDNFIYIVVNFLYGFLFFILYLIVFAIPVVLFAALIYFISFGRIGLVKKLFKFLSGKKKG